jgi:hypothetical protein
LRELGGEGVDLALFGFDEGEEGFALGGEPALGGSR